jgi:hypothetical protein
MMEKAYFRQSLGDGTLSGVREISDEAMRYALVFGFGKVRCGVSGEEKGWNMR